ncbi:MAG: DUF1566 domain-containing protein [Prevotella sp.]|nr:DUF1566 domain-containing protein [Prevotella sp.]
MKKLPITEKAQEYGAKVKVSSDARKQLDEGWQQHFDIEIEDAFSAGVQYALDEVNKPREIAPNMNALRLILSIQNREQRKTNNASMTENQKFRLELFREFKGEAQKAYDFIMAGENKQTDTEPTATNQQVKGQDGIYLVYEDGSYKPYTGSNEKKDAKGVKYIGLVEDGHPFCIALKDLGSYQLLRDGVKCPSESPFYMPREVDALHDWECVERTKHIQELGTDIPLADGEYIPALPMLVAICRNVKEINKALEFAGGTPFDMDEDYWSVTEYHSFYAWGVHFFYGGVFNHTKYTSGVVRPVAAFTYDI